MKTLTGSALRRSNFHESLRQDGMRVARLEWTNERVGLIAALQVLTMTPVIVKFLEQVDPKALAQARAAIAKATGEQA